MPDTQSGRNAEPVQRNDKEVRNEPGVQPAGEHLQRRQKRNTDLTEKAQQDPSGGAHSGTPDPTNP